MITKDVRKYAAEQGLAVEEALKNGMEEKPKEFANKGKRTLRESSTRIPMIYPCVNQQLVGWSVL